MGKYLTAATELRKGCGDAEIITGNERRLVKGLANLCIGRHDKHTEAVIIDDW